MLLKEKVVNIEKAKKIFSNLNMTTYVANIYNGKYKILKKEWEN